jgi:predicted Fe-Mo cluster-binding NifX family protein
MKIAVSTTGEKASSPVDPRFGRSRWFIVFDTETGEHTVLDNSRSADSASGAGIASAQSVIDAGVGTVLTGRCGPKAARTLAEGGVRIVEGVSGTAEEAFKAARSGELG